MKFILTIGYVAPQYLKRISIAFFSVIPAFRGYKVAYFNRGYLGIVRFFLQRRQGLGAKCIRQHHGLKAETVSGNGTVGAKCIRQHCCNTKLFAMFAHSRQLERKKMPVLKEGDSIR